MKKKKTVTLSTLSQGPKVLLQSRVPKRLKRVFKRALRKEKITIQGFMVRAMQSFINQNAEV